MALLTDATVIVEELIIANMDCVMTVVSKKLREEKG
jgi:hypothetical protein